MDDFKNNINDALEDIQKGGNDSLAMLMSLLFPGMSNVDTESGSSIYEKVLIEAVGSNSQTIFGMRDMMRQARKADKSLQDDALSTGMALCSIADGMFIEENYNGSLIRYVRSAIRYDNPRAQWRIGMCLYHGFYVEKDTEESKKWFVESAKHTYKNAIDSLEKYYSGSTVTEDTEEAKENFIALISLEPNEW